MLANLLDEDGLRGIGEASRELGVPIRAYYLSNAEDYWNYPDEFRANFENLLFDESSVILRANATKSRNGDYRYNMQDAIAFQAWLREPGTRSVDDVWDRTWVRDETDIPFDRTRDLPPEDGAPEEVTD